MAVALAGTGNGIMADGDRSGCDPVALQADMFRLYVGPGRRIPGWGPLSDATGVPLSSLKSYAQGTVMPYPVLLRLIAVLPIEAGNMLLAPAGFKLAAIETDDDDWNGIGAEASLLTFEICDAQRDGRIDHVETARLKKRVATLVAKAASAL